MHFTAHRSLVAFDVTSYTVEYPPLLTWITT
jgi:hypothetical protein